jgi:LysM repeat protein
MLAVIGVALLAGVLLFVIANSLGGSDSDEGKGGKGGGQAKAEKSDEGKFYTVEPGDSLTSIADKTGVSVDKLSQLNPDLDPQALISGQRVKLR